MDCLVCAATMDRERKYCEGGCTSQARRVDEWRPIPSPLAAWVSRADGTYQPMRWHSEWYSWPHQNTELPTKIPSTYFMPMGVPCPSWQKDRPLLHAVLHAAVLPADGVWWLHGQANLWWQTRTWDGRLRGRSHVLLRLQTLARSKVPGKTLKSLGDYAFDRESVCS